MQRSLKLILAFTLAGCAAADPASPGDEPVEEGMRWITIGADALETAQMALDERIPGRVLTPVQMAADVAILSYDAADFHSLSELMHVRHNRCGGFMVHDSLKDAQLALRGTKEADSVGALAVSYTLDNAATVNGMLPELQETRIVQMITDLSAYQNRYYTSSFGVQSSDFIFNQWTSIAAARPDITVERFTHTWQQSSVILTIPGSTLASEVVIMGGHQDSIASGNATSIAPGADDDASGIATLSEVLRAMVAKNYRPLRTIKMMAYAAEEVGLRGSAAIAADYQTRGVNVVGVVQFDMTNYKGSTKDIWLMQDYTNAAQNTFVQNLITTYLTGVTFGVDSCGYGCSDHASWHNRGYAASMPFESAMSQYNPNIHTSNDRLSVSGGNAAHAMKFARLGVAYAAELAKGTLGTTPGNNPPTVSITAPAAGATVSGVITVSASASDSDGTVASVAFTMPNGSVVTDTTAPYSATFDTALVTNGSYTLRAVATDNAGAASSQSSVAVTVQNGAPGCINGTFNATGLPLSIPDNIAAGITSNLAVTGAGTVASLALSMNLTHTYRGDLVVTLVSPTGTQFLVSNRAGAGADNLILTNSPVTTFNGQTAAGTWQLKVVDAAGGDVGALNSWSLTITGNCTPGNQAPTATITAPAAGATVSGTITVTANAADADGTVASVRFELPNGSVVTDTTAPYSASFNTALVVNGSQVLRAIATDNAGATSTASTVTVNVQNTTGSCINGTFNATGLPVNIPDNNTTGITSNLAVTGAGTVATLALSLNITHTYRGDLVVTLISPAGTQYVVSSRAGGSADNLVLTSSAITTFNNQTAAGTWQLKARDAASADIGALNSWSLTITGNCPTQPPVAALQ